MELPLGVTIDDGVVSVELPTVTGQVQLQGATVTSWKPAGAHEVLFLSPQAVFDGSSEVFGGVPVVAPWFGPGRNNDKPHLHGYVQFRTWTLESAVPVEDGVVLTFLLREDHEFRYSVTLNRSDLTMSLTITAGSAALDVEQALHTYLAVADVRDTTVRGLEGVSYLDKTADYTELVQTGEVRFGEEVDSVYLGPTDVMVHDAAGGRRLRISGEGGRNTVVWNPGESKAKTLPHYDAADWTRMVCVETANVLDNFYLLDPGQSHTLTQTISIA